MENNSTSTLDQTAAQLVAKRGRPLLILYYQGDDGHMGEEYDAEDVYQELRKGNLTKENRTPKLDVLLHTPGGEPGAAYLIGQTIRMMAEEVEFLIPKYALSAGSLLVLSGNRIWFGDNAFLSPIDITIEEDTLPATKVSLATIEHYLDFATEARRRVELMLQQLGSTSRTSLESDLLGVMVTQVGALKIGEYYRERLLSEKYAELFLNRYMFRGASDAHLRREEVIAQMLHKSPSHDYNMDYDTALEAQLSVGRLETELSDLAKAIVAQLDRLADRDQICERYGDNYRSPHVQFVASAGHSTGGPDGTSRTYENNFPDE